MRRITVVLVFIITTFLVVLPSWAASSVQFISIPGHLKDGPILYFNYKQIYDRCDIVRRMLPMYAGHTANGEIYKIRFLANVGYLMNKYHSWYVYVEDPLTEDTDDEVTKALAINPVHINITEALIQNLDKELGQGRYAVLSVNTGIWNKPVAYYDLPIFMSESIFHLIY